MYALTPSMKGTTCRRFANMVFKKVDIKVRGYSFYALNMELSDDLNKTKDRTLNLPFQASSIFSVNSGCNLNPRIRNLSTAASFAGDNTSATTTAVLPVDDSGSRGVARIGEGKKAKKIETDVSVIINLDGSGVADSDSGIPFLDKMLHEFASQGLFDVHVKATGNIDVDQRITNEDVGHAIGMALQEAVGDNKDIKRFGSFFAPHHEVLIHVAIDLSGHSHLDFDYNYYSDEDEDEDEDDDHDHDHEFDTYQIELVKPFFESLVNTSGMTLHIRRLTGSNLRRLIEATFKAFAGALRQATEFDPHRRPHLVAETLPTSKD